jgi:Flp pilus assembly secretin CpaC
MCRCVISSCVLLLGSQIALAEESAISSEPHAKQGEVQLNDIIVVVIDRDSTSKDGALRPNDAPKFERVAASVVNIRPNGDLEIEAHSKIPSGEKILEHSLTGVVHRKSLGPDRIVRRQDVAEFRLKTRKKDNVQNGPGFSAVMPHPVRQVAAQSAVWSKIAVLRQKQAELSQLQQEIRQLRAETHTQQQIMVRVQMLEVSLTKLEKLRLDVSSVESRSLSVNDVSNLATASKILRGSGFTQLPGKGESDGAQRLIKVLTQSNVAKILAEPSVLAMDGQSAAVHVGSEIPYPAIPGPQGTVEFRQVGAQLDVLPTSLGENRVRLELKLRKSDADFSQMREINGARVPLINVSQCNTAIESEFGQSTVLSGLVETRTEAVKCGGKTEDVSNRVALVFVVTPDLVEATRTAQLPVSPK